MICTILTDGSELRTACQNEEEQPILTVRSRLLTLLQTLTAQGYDEVWLNCEYGVSLWAAECLLKLRKILPVHVNIAVPYEEQSTNWTEEQRDRYYAIHEQSDSVVLLGTQFTDNCYALADRYMIDRSDLVVICGMQGSVPEAAEYADERSVRVVYVDLVSDI